MSDVQERDGRKEWYKERRGYLKKRRRSVQQLHYLMLSMALLTLFLIPIFLFTKAVPESLAPFMAIYVVAPICILPVSRSRLRDIEQDIKEIDFEIDLQDYQIGVAETRAEKVLRINDSQLQRYYNVNLSQNMWVFGLGVFCMLLGMVVIAGALYIVLSFARTLEVRLITAVLGAIGSLMTGYISAIYLKMHSAASEHLGMFHSRLVETHQILLANLLASRINNVSMREDTLSKLAVEMSRPIRTCAGTEQLPAAK